MSSDRELVEFAAKACDTPGIWKTTFDETGASKPLWFKDSDDEIWDPLGDDGDALRLAVKLNIEIHLDLEVGTVITAFMVGRVGGNTFEEVSENSGCEYLTTRRAIVRAAAEIGRALP